MRGATKLILSDSASLISAAGAEHVTLSGLVLDGQRRRLPDRRGLLHIENVRRIKIADCEILGAGGTAIACTAVDGEIVDTLITDSADVAIHSFDARALLIARNTISGAGNNGIQVWRGNPGDDGTIVIDNRIEAIENRSGGSGQYGNAINVFRAANVIVRGNRIRNCAFTAVRGNAASNFQIARQQHHRRARGRDLCRVRLRGRAGREQHHRRRGDRRLDHQFQPGRTARERAPATSSATCCRSGRPAPTRATAPASASRSRPTPR